MKNTQYFLAFYHSNIFRHYCVIFRELKFIMKETLSAHT